LATEQKASDDLRTAGQTFLTEFINKPKSEYETLQEEAGVLSAKRLVSALKGELPVSPELIASKKRDFTLLKESAGRQGITITGDEPGGASADSTAGAAMLEAFNNRYAYAENLDRRGEIDSGTSQNLQRYGLISDIATQKFNQATSMASGSSATVPIGLASSALSLLSPNSSGYSTLMGGQSSLSGTLSQENLLKYQSLLQQYAGTQAGNQAVGNLIGQGLTAWALA
jgi:hypothetical protein